MRIADTSFANAVIRNAWNWDLDEFARRISRDPEDENTQKLFRTFQNLAGELRKIDPQVLSVMGQP